MEQKFKSGDVVQLNSGGPKMTVDFNKTRLNVGDIKTPLFEGTIICKWFVGEKLEEGEFKQDMLSIA